MQVTLSERLRQLRNERDVSLREAGQKIGVSAMHLSDIEAGRRYPSEKVMQALASYFGVQMEDLMACDSRPPVDEIKRVASSHPAVGFAFRSAMDQVKKGEISPEELAARINGHR